MDRGTIPCSILMDGNTFFPREVRHEFLFKHDSTVFAYHRERIAAGSIASLSVLQEAKQYARTQWPSRTS